MIQHDEPNSDRYPGGNYRTRRINSPTQSPKSASPTGLAANLHLRGHRAQIVEEHPRLRPSPRSEGGLEAWLASFGTVA